ncbi:putative 3-hydroxybutyryl-CoA dehydrogenase [[Clostridium] ultunense Esp]|nr:putative 3-hydroxybutyryl-CoA dehydrogenase [[Clostridium] ultunense Esp]
MKEIKNILICGAGMMGKGLAQVFSACEDLNVTVHNRRERDIYGPIRQNLEQLRDKGIITDEEIDARLSRIRFTTDMESSQVKNADLVIECVAEEMELKQDLFAKLEGICREDCILATNTSVMSPTEISAKVKHKERIIGTHFWNPAHLIPLVEVVKTAYTSDEVVNSTMAALEKAGKKPVLCKKDVPGFIANRMQHALWREAISIVQQGIADAKTVDDAVKYSFGLRLPQLGPMENADMVGLQLTYNIHDYILKYLEDSHEPLPIIKEYLAEGKEGFKSGEGFQSWIPEAIEKSKRDLNEYLIKMIYGV